MNAGPITAKPHALVNFLAGRYGIFAFIAAFIALVLVNWVGFLASDDVTYAIGAYGWIEHFPFVGGHGTIRYPVTIPMALSFLTFGENEYAMALPSLLYITGFMYLAHKFVRHFAAGSAVIWVMLLLITCPLIVIQSSIANVDGPEWALQFLGFCAFYRSLDNPRPTPYLIVAGIASGIAFLTRETAIFVAVFYAILFLFGYGHTRARLLWIAAGFLGVWAVEICYLWIMTGDPLYRINISLHHDATIDRSIDVAGNLIVHPFIDPLLVLLFNQEFMLLFPGVLMIGPWLCFRAPIDQKMRRALRLLCLLGLTIFVCTGAVQSLLPLNPRYFLAPTAVAAIVTGLGLFVLSKHRRWLALLILVVLLGTNILGAYLENGDSQLGARIVAKVAAQSPQAHIVTDPMTRYRADMLLKWENAQDRVSDKPPVNGDLYVYNPAYAATANFKMSADQIASYIPPTNAKLIKTFAPQPSMLVSVIERSGLAAYLPQRSWHKLRYHHVPVELWQITDAATKTETR